MSDCEPDYRSPGQCAAHGSVFRGAVCEAVLIQRVRELCDESGEGWFEWLMPAVATTHITYVHENGNLYQPEGESDDAFLLASAEGRVYRLVRARDILRALDGER